MNPDSAVGNYLNFLEVGNLIILPEFTVTDKMNQNLKEVFITIYPDRKIEGLNMTRMAKKEVSLIVLHGLFKNRLSF